MINKSSGLIIIAASLASFAVLAEDQGSPAPASQVVSPTSSAAPSVPVVTGPGATKSTDTKAEKSSESPKDKHQSKASQKEIENYKIKVASLISVQARKQGSIGNGYAAVSFRIGEDGGVGGIAVKSSSSPKHAEAARRIVSAIRAGSPPGGSISLNQRFQFK